MKRNFFYYAALVSMLSASMLVTSCEDNTKPEPGPQNGDVLSGDVTENVTLTSGSTYELQGAYTVKEGATLTIEPGVKIIAKKGATVSFILVQQGGKIDAKGTADSPIVMTSDVQEHGAWGGIHICGKAKTNVSDGISEVGDSPYGGSDDSDNSGSLKYVRVEYAGYLYSEDKECNGFTFYGVGNGTTLENLVAYKGSDDGYEWFGGSVNAKNLVSVDNLDDSFDWTYGYTGTIDGAYAKHLSNECDHLMEGDNNKSDNSIAPVSHPTFKNVVLVGIDRDGGDRGIRIRRGSKLTLENAEVVGKTHSFDLQSDATKAYFAENAATALVNVVATGDIIDAQDSEPVKSSVLTGLSFEPTLAPSNPSWLSGEWVNAEGITDAPAVDEVKVLKGSISENVTLEAGKTYSLEGAYTVKEGATLKIEKGVKIIAEKGESVSFILVQQGAKIDAQGTAEEPIVMTSSVKEHGAWGGIHICGKAKINIGEGISEVGDSAYGGDDDADNSGVLKFVRVEYAGYLYSEDKECNGFTFYGVGNGTTLENLEAYKGSDDGYEWFGGCVNAKNLISIDNLDDSFDWTYGYRGTIDGAFAKHLSDECDHLMEGDNNKSDNAKAPVSHPTFKNAVLVGIDRDGGNRGIRIRRGSELTLENAEVAGKTNSLDFQSEATKDYFTANAATALVNVKISGAIVDAEDNAPLAASIFSGLTVDSSLNPAVPAWVAGNWTLIK